MLRRTFLKSLLLTASIPLLANINTTPTTALNATQLIRLAIKHQKDTHMLIAIHDKVYELPNRENTHAALRAFRSINHNAYINFAKASSNSKYGYKAVFTEAANSPLGNQIHTNTTPASFRTAEIKYTQILKG